MTSTPNDRYKPKDKREKVALKVKQAAEQQAHCERLMNVLVALMTVAITWAAAMFTIGLTADVDVDATACATLMTLLAIAGGALTAAHHFNVQAGKAMETKHRAELELDRLDRVAAAKENKKMLRAMRRSRRWWW